jgi:hypothetical protein
VTTPRRPSTTPATIISSRAQTTVDKKVTVYGMTTLPSKRFLLFGQTQSKDGHEDVGYLATLKDDLTIEKENTSAIGSVVWNVTASPYRDDQCIVLTNNSRDRANSSYHIRYQYFNTSTLAPVFPSNLAGFCGGATWAPFAFNRANYMLHAMGTPIPQEAWQVEPQRNLMWIATDMRGYLRYRPYIATHSISVSPNKQYMLLGCGEVPMLEMHSKKQETDSEYSACQTLPVAMDDYTCGGWFGDSKHFFACVRRNNTVIFANVNYPLIQVTVHLETQAHSAVALSHQPTLVVSHVDGSLKMYDVSDALNVLDSETHTHNTLEKAKLVETLIPSQRGSVGRAFKGFIERDMVCVDNTLLCRERGTQQLEKIVLNPSLHILSRLSFFNGHLHADAVNIISEYYTGLPDSKRLKHE